MTQQSKSRSWVSKILDSLSPSGKGKGDAARQQANYVPPPSAPPSFSAPGQDDLHLFEAQIAELMGPGSGTFSLPKPADMDYVDEQIEEFLAGTVVNSLPKVQPLPLPQWTDHPTVGPPLTPEITDAFTMCYAVYRLHAGVMAGNQPMASTILRTILTNLPILADEQLRQQAWQFFSHYWAYLDDGSRRWIVDTSRLLEWFQTKDRQGKNLHPFEQKVLLERYGPFFEWFEGILKWYKDQQAQSAETSA